MSTTVPSVPFSPCVRFFSGRSESFIQCGEQWRRMTAEDEAKSCTGYDRETNETSVGVFVERRGNGLLRLGFDLWRIDANLRLSAIERLERRWRQESASLSKSMLRHAARRAQFSKSFMRFEVAPERVEGWKLELEAVLSNPGSYVPLERRAERY